MSTKNYIIGGGIAGMIASYYSGYKIIDKNPLGQLNLRFIPGVRLLKVDDDVKDFLEELNTKIKLYDVLQEKEIEVGYVDVFDQITSLSEDFKKRYSLNTRGKEEYEKSFLSSGESSFSVFTADQADPNLFYINLFTALKQWLDDNDMIIYDKVVSVNTELKSLFLHNDGEGSYIDYDDLISTIRIDFLEQMMHDFSGKYEHNYEILKKHFYKCKYIDNNEEYYNKYAYSYALSNVYTRKSFFPGYIVFETIETINEKQNFIKGHRIIDKYENVPLQIKNSLNLTSFKGIKLIGRFAQWNHSIKSNELIKSCKILKQSEKK